MTPLEARDIILAPFKTAWDPRVAVYPDVPGNIPTGEVTWARANITHVIGGQSSLAGETGTRRFTAKGFATFQIFAPVGDGSTACYSAATEVLQAYQEIRDSAVWFRNPRLLEVGADGAFNQINVLVDFSYDDVR